MSNHLITETYKRKVGSMADNAVLLLMADKASDDGSGIFASKQTMADELCTTKPTIRRSIDALAKLGVLEEVGQRKSATGYTVEYAIKVDNLKALPLVDCHAAKEERSVTGNAALPVKQRDRRGNVTLPKPLLNQPTEDKSSSGSAREARRDKGWPELPDWLPAEPWNGWLAMRKKQGKWPTARSVEITLGKLAQWREQGQPPGDVLDQSTERGWTGIFELKTNGRNGHGQGIDRRDGIAKAIDHELERIGAAKAQRRGANGGEEAGWSPPRLTGW